MEITLGLMKFFFSVTLCLSVTLLIWDKFFRTAEDTMEVEEMMPESEEMMEVGNTAEKFVS